MEPSTGSEPAYGAQESAPPRPADSGGGVRYSEPSAIPARMGDVISGPKRPACRRGQAAGAWPDLAARRGSLRQSVPAGSLVGQLDPLADIGVDHRMVTHHVAAPDGMHADFGFGAFAHHAFPAMADILVVLEIARFRQDLGQTSGRPRWASLSSADGASPSTSRSKSGPRISAVFRVSQKSVFTPTLSKLGAKPPESPWLPPG